MSDALLVLAVAVPAGLICPITAWWRARNGRAASCCAPATGDADLQQRLERLRADIDARAQSERHAA